jgi:hypothetical protein
MEKKGEEIRYLYIIYTSMTHQLSLGLVMTEYQFDQSCIQALGQIQAIVQYNFRGQYYEAYREQNPRVIFLLVVAYLPHQPVQIPARPPFAPSFSVEARRAIIAVFRRSSLTFLD